MIVQHVRERGHPFNTARMVNSALKHCKLFCGSNEALAKIQLPIQPDAGLLYPSKQARTLADLAVSEKPKQLILIDGTWSQARTMLRDLGQLNHLPHYKLAPTQPGQYRIRLEPTDTSLSTVEAAVEALREIEPETSGLDELLVAFETMVQRQLDHPRVGREHYSGGPKSGSTINIPKRLLSDPNSIVVAYGETGYRANRRPNDQDNQDAKQSARERGVARLPLFWVAKRLEPGASGTRNLFARALKPDVLLTDTFLDHLELAHEQFNHAITPQRFRDDWRSFLQPGDTVVVYNQGAIGLLENIDANFESSLALKSINFDPRPCRRTLSQFVQQEGLPYTALDPEFGRAGKRLSNAVAVVNYLRGIADRD